MHIFLVHVTKYEAAEFAKKVLPDLLVNLDPKMTAYIYITGLLVA